MADNPFARRNSIGGGGGGGGGGTNPFGRRGGTSLYLEDEDDDGGGFLGGVRHDLGTAAGAVGGFAVGVADLGYGLGYDIAHGQHPLFGRGQGAFQGSPGDLQFWLPFNKTKTTENLTPMVDAYRYKYGPAFHGDFGETAHRMNEDRFGTFLDLLTVGLPVVGRGAAIASLGKGATAADRAYALKTGQWMGAPTIELKLSPKGKATVTRRVLPRTGHRAARMVATNAVLKKVFPSEFPMLGETSRAARANTDKFKQKILQHESSEAFQSYRLAYHAMTRKEKIAFDLVNSTPMEVDVEWWRGILPVGEMLPQQVHYFLSDDKIMDYYRNPTEKMWKANTAGHALDDYMSSLKIQQEWLSPIAASAAPFTHMKIARGARFLTPERAEKQLKKLNRQIARLEKGKGQILRSGQRAGRVEVTGSLAEARRLAVGAARSSRERTRLRVQADTVDATRAEVEALSAQLERLSNTDLGVYADEVEITPETPAGPSTVGHAMAEALAKAGEKPAVGEVLPDAETLGGGLETAFHYSPTSPTGPLHSGDVMGREWLGVGVYLSTKPGNQGLLPRMGAKAEGTSTRMVDRTTLFRLGDQEVTGELLDRVKAGIGNKAITAKFDKLLSANRQPLTTKRLYFLLAKATHVGKWTPKNFDNLLHSKELTRTKTKINRILTKAGFTGIEYGSDLIVFDPKNVRRWEAPGKPVPASEAATGVIENQGAARSAAQSAIEDSRVQSLGEVFDAMGEATMRHQDALEAEQKLQHEILFGSQQAGRQEANVGRIAAAREARIAMLRAQREQFQELLVWQEQLAKSAEKVRAGVNTVFGGPSIKELRQEIADAGRPMPFYMPDVMAKKPNPYRRIRARATGPVDAHEPPNTGKLFLEGRVALHIDKLGPDFLRAARNDATDEMYRRVLAQAEPAPRGELVGGYEWVRTKKGQYFTPEATHSGEQARSVEKMFPDLFEDGFSSPDHRLHRSNPDQVARNASGEFLMIPSRAAKVLGAELKVTRSQWNQVFNRIMDVWRALVLKIRIPWLTSNLIGNAILAGVRNAGPNGPKALLGAINQTKGAQAAKRAVGIAEDAGWGLTDDMVAKYAPQQRKSGTFLGTTTGEALPRWAREAGEPVKYSAMVVTKAINVLPHIDKAWESFMRRFTMNNILLDSDEVRNFYLKMPKETRDFKKAMEMGLQDEKINMFVNREVNDALGDFLSLTPKESNAIRNVFPFYAWFREILRITARMPFNAPLKTNILYQIGLIGEQIQNDQFGGPLPTYLRGSYAIGEPDGDLQRVINTRPWVPWNSAVDVVSALGALLPGGTPANAFQFMGSTNPFISSGVRTASKITAPNRGVPRKSEHGLVYDMLRDVILGLPEARVFRNQPSEVYPTRTQTDLARRFFGDPTAIISISKAQQEQEAGK